MRHKILILLVILLVGFFIFTFLNKKTAEAPVISNPDNISLEDKIKNTKIIIPDTDISIDLINGSATFENNNSEGSITILSILNQFNNEQDVFAEAIVEFGGSGSFKYLMSFENPENLKYKSYAFIGDRVPFISLTQLDTDNTGYFIELIYLDRAKDAPLTSQPNIKTSKIFRIENANILPTRSQIECSGNECSSSIDKTLIYVDNIISGQKIQSPLKISGQARGVWFFEASFPIVLTNWDGVIIAEGIATANSEWMTEDFVSFTATLNFVKPSLYNSGNLILQKDNPSGMPEFDDALEINVTF
jgi:hypothetical protein